MESRMEINTKSKVRCPK